MRACVSSVAAVLAVLAASPALAAPSAKGQNLKWFVIQGIGAGEGGAAAS